MFSLKLERIVTKFLNHKIVLVIAESCTGGLVSKTFTDIPGSSAWFDSGFITYSNNSKINLLKVNLNTLEKFGAVSQEIANEMALGAEANSNANFSIAITGIAGPSGGTKSKPVGTIFISFVYQKKIIHQYRLNLSGNREEIRAGTLNFIISELDKLTFNIQI
ncbi:MAG: CinA family protein [Proteobacteria bacterium]|jgi:nicotinamide-nucleotide amidase|nr:CinA family protein [Pseudomonadota bacterium]MDA0941396.1 CinA family protein [Pseudomonadota bacterium]MDA1033982.1 CinA family protein [Pseudomonadota bacterium]